MSVDRYQPQAGTTGVVTADQGTDHTAVAQTELQAAVLLARQFARDEEAVWERALRTCRRPSFAEQAMYAIPRGGTTVRGPSVYLARELARLWGNIRYGSEIIADTATHRTVRVWAWDIEANTRVAEDVTMAKLVARKRGGKETVMVEPTEIELREMTARQAAIATRNCLLRLLPADLVEACCEAAEQTLRAATSKQRPAVIEQLVQSYARFSVTPQMIEAYIGRPLAQVTDEQLTDLRRVYRALADGQATWGELTDAADGGLASDGSGR